MFGMHKKEETVPELPKKEKQLSCYKVMYEVRYWSRYECDDPYSLFTRDETEHIIAYSVEEVVKRKYELFGEGVEITSICKLCDVRDR